MKKPTAGCAGRTARRGSIPSRREFEAKEAGRESPESSPRLAFLNLVGMARRAVRAALSGATWWVIHTWRAARSARSDAGGDIAARCPCHSDLHGEDERSRLELRRCRGIFPNRTEARVVERQTRQT